MMVRKPLPRSLRYRRPLVVPPVVGWRVCRECEAHVSWCDHPDTHTHVVLTPDTKKPGAPME